MNLVRLASDEHPTALYELEVLSSWVSRLRGLLGTGPKARPVLLTRCASVHSYGMRYALDVAFVGRRGEVLEVVRSMQPGSTASAMGAVCVIERPAKEGEWLVRGEHLWIVSASIGMAV